MGNFVELGAEIERLRGEMTQAELGRRIGLSRERVGQLERGRNKDWPSPEVFNALARELHVPTTTLLRAAGAAIPTWRSEELEWLAAQLSDQGVGLLVKLGHALLTEYRRLPESGK